MKLVTRLVTLDIKGNEQMDDQKFSSFDSKAIIEVLEHHSGDRMSARDIVEFLYDQNPEHFNKQKEKREKNYIHINDLIMQLSAEVHSRIKGNNKVIRYKDGSRVYYKIRDDYNPKEKKKRQYNNREKHLYPIVREYLRKSHRVFSMRIDERRSSGVNGGVRDSKRFPDIVGMEEDSSLVKTWSDDIMAISNMTSGKKIGIWSVEVKVEVTHRSVREDLSQTLSNSSWANRAYLAASKFPTSEDDELEEHIKNELDEYADEHGIGVIEIDKNNPKKSKIIIEAREREVNWSSVNSLAKRNKDFMRFIKIYRRYYECNTGDKDWKNMIGFLLDFGVLEEES